MKFLFKGIFPLLFIVACSLLVASCRSMDAKKPRPVKPRQPGGLERHEITHQDRTRHYYLYLPPGVKSSAKLPLLLVFHGDGQTPDDIIGLSGFNALADSHKFAVVYPAGTGSNPERLSWNIVKSGMYATLNKVDDVGFLDAVVRDLEGRVKIDDSRIYAAGFSQGGMFCFRLACDAGWSEKLAAIATVGATIAVDPKTCDAARTVPLIAFHGTDDPFSNFKGGIAAEAPRYERIARASYPDTINLWVQRHGITNSPQPGESRGDAVQVIYGSGTGTPVVVSWELQGAGHTWPGGPSVLPVWISGAVNRDVNASSEIWGFFGEHALDKNR